MPLFDAGDRLGPYEILSKLGEGGMGVVYRARDTRLDRIVAIKVAADRFNDRFEREARAIAQLNHPHICQLHDIGPDYLVMEYVDGKPLTGPLPLDRTVALSCEILDAIGAAHKRGITHRDLKPANILLTKQGIKLLDFGLAKKSAVSGHAPDHGETRGAITAAGQIVGTLQYMAPEQLQGQEADHRSDLFSFGCVLYELLTGRRAFDASDPASVIAAVLTRDAPSVADVAPPLDRIVRRALAKDPEQRFQTAGDLKAALLWAMEQPAPLTPTTRSRSVLKAALGTVAAMALVATGATAAWLLSRSSESGGDAVRFEIQPPAGGMWSPSPIASVAQLAMSPDGRLLAFVAALKRGAPQIWIRPLSSAHATPLAGTEGASFPFWSPDSRAIGFFAGGKLKTVDISGGHPQEVADATAGRGAAWSATGDIVFISTANSPINRIASSGGKVTAETSLRNEEEAISHYFPQFLPGGRRFLYYQRSRRPEHTGIYVKTVGVSDAARVLATSGRALYTPGYLLHVRDGTLLAVPVDDKTLQVEGDAVRLAEGVGYFSMTLGYAAFSVSDRGVLAYGRSILMTTALQWRDRTGVVVGTPMPPAMYRSPRLTPDQTGVAVALVAEGRESPDIYIFDLLRGGRSRVTASPVNNWFPVWAPDGRRLYFASARNGPSSIFQKDPSAAGDGDPLTPPSAAGEYPTDLSDNGRDLLIQRQSTVLTGYDLVVTRTDAPDKTTPFLTSRFNEIQGRFSPNGRWVAYASDESGRFEIYVRPYPAGPGQWPISANGGMQPHWRADGKELFFLAGDGKLMAADVATEGTSFTAGVPRALFDVDVPESGAPHAGDYDVSADGKRFLINGVVDQPTKPAVTVILNWTAELPRR